MFDRILDLLGEVANRAQVELRKLQVIEEFGLSQFQAKTLAMIGRKPGGTQQEFAATMGSDKAQMARTIRELEGRALIFRQAHETDWRAQCLHLTCDGERIYGALSAQRSALGGELLGGLTDRELVRLEATLGKMREQLLSRSG